MKLKPQPALNSLSIGFYAKRFSIHPKGSAVRRTLQAVHLAEVSLVTDPSTGRRPGGSCENANSPVVAIRRTVDLLLEYNLRCRPTTAAARRYCRRCERNARWKRSAGRRSSRSAGERRRLAKQNRGDGEPSGQRPRIPQQAGMVVGDEAHERAAPQGPLSSHAGLSKLASPGKHFARMLARCKRMVHVCCSSRRMMTTCARWKE